jgi:hypothetical protein
MSKNTLTDGPARVKPEPPTHPILAMLRTIEHACTDRDRLVAAQLKNLCRILEGHEAANAA